MARLLRFLERLARTGFYGTVLIRFKSGDVAKITVEQDYLMETLPE